MKKNKGYITIAGAIIFSSIIICFSIITNKPTKPSFDHLTIKVEKTPAEQIIINNNSNYPDGLFGVKIRTDIKDYLHDKDQLLLNLIYKESENYYIFGSPKSGFDKHIKFIKNDLFKHYYIYTDTGYNIYQLVLISNIIENKKEFENSCSDSKKELKKYLSSKYSFKNNDYKDIFFADSNNKKDSYYVDLSYFTYEKNQRLYFLSISCEYTNERNLSEKIKTKLIYKLRIGNPLDPEISNFLVAKLSNEQILYHLSGL